MDCETIRNRHIADEYRAGRLSAEEAEAYEQHYFACDRCLEDLRFRDQVAGHLRADGAELFAEEIAATARGGKQAGSFGWLPTLRPAWAAALVAVAAVVLVVLVVQRNEHRSRLKDLWTPVAHPYVASELRAGVETDAFARGMAHYQDGRYREAAELLEETALTALDDDQVHFYLGVSLLLADEPHGAVRALERAVARMPSSALYQWYLAQAELECGNADGAVEILQRVGSTGTEYAAPARRLSERIADER